ncbi:o-succinylbenzoate--CoA ligase [Williamsia sp. CHRR-6]|nr:o-succinylbenzoate--CoA ligase [Williamsia sp. CHRR-6]MBT0565943.1 o-succinylbenzoate--CoA ligase [Williamsia sp. CHRR-6]
MKTLELLPIGTGPAALTALDTLAQVLDGSVAVVPAPADDPVETHRLTSALGVGEPIDNAVSLVVSTSGSTGIPKGAMHTPSSLAASAAATEARLGGPGGWLLALPTHHIAGLQVLLRSIRSGHPPVAIDVAHGFDPGDLIAGLDALDAPRRYTSLVPTQLVKVLDHPGAVGALREIDAVLVGGAATPVPLLHRAIEAGIPVVRTYGMSETGGGCVYDGVPLDGVEVSIVDPTLDGVGRVIIRGPVVAQGYRGLDHPAFAVTGEFGTDDLGRLDNGVLSVVGRADEAISSGGLTVVPQVVEAAILTDPTVAECAVIGLPDERLGERVVAVVVAAVGAHISPDRLRENVTERLGRFAAPREVIEVDAMPLRGPGKIDRRALRARYASG